MHSKYFPFLFFYITPWREPAPQQTSFKEAFLLHFSSVFPDTQIPQILLLDWKLVLSKNIGGRGENPVFVLFRMHN